MNSVAGQPTGAAAEANVLTDGVVTCPYTALPEVFDSLTACFRKHGIPRETCLAFECENSVPSAFILLFLLETGRDFLLIPKRNQGLEAVPVEVPAFCAYRVAATPNRFTDLNDSSYVDLTPNKAFLPRDGSPSEPTFYVRTSGSTGVPKLAAHTHRGLRLNALNCVERFQMKGSDRVTIPVPLSHMYGLGAAFIPAVSVSASVDLQNGANVLAYIARERAFQPNRTYLTPTFCASLLKGRRGSRAYELTVSSGDRLRGDTFERYEARYGPMVQLYGCTELGAIAATSPDDPAEARAETVGTPLSGVEVCMGAPAAGATLALEASETEGTAELLCRHPHGFCAYADQTGVLRVGSAGAAGDWFHLHDIGRIGPDGRIQVRGRSDHAVNRSGLLALFADIEASIMTIPGIETAVVVASGESDYGVGLAAFCVPTGGTAMGANDIQAACLECMPRREVPDLIIVVDNLPLLSNGKIDRQALIMTASASTTAASAEREAKTAKRC